ncbi:hypothetical protein TI05_07355 [Achromatium sp. WMS3]|nr:hypothetical protein TI05_07355 [Achromatium sp. WMS3]
MLVNTTNLYQIRQTAFEVLNRELGPVAMIRFLQQYESGYGDYSKDRHQWIDNFSVADIVENMNRKAR